MGDEGPRVIYGHIEPYQTGQDWNEYIERLEQYFEANSITDEGKKKSMFLTLIGPQTYSLVRNLVSPALPKDKTFDEMKTSLENHLCPKPLVIAERFKFHRRDQREGELCSKFLAELRRLTEHCNFGNFLQDALRDRFVCGLKDERIQRRLLSEKDLTLQKALEIATAMETAAKDSSEIKHNPVDPKVNKIQTATPKQAKKPCYRCGGQHAPHTCRFQSETCNYCRKTGHLYKMCLKRKSDEKKGKLAQSADKASKPQGSKPQAKGQNDVKKKHQSHFVDFDDTPDEYDDHDDYHMYFLQTPRIANTEPITVSMEVNDHASLFEVDTGSSVSILNKSTFDSSGAELLPWKHKLRTYTDEQVPILGCSSVKVEYEGQVKELSVLVSPDNGPNLFGRDWLQHIKLDWQKAITPIQRMNYIAKDNIKLKEVLTQYSDVFKKELGTFKGAKAKIYVDPEAQPKYYKPRPLPFVLKPKVEKALDKLENEGTMSPVEFSEWAAPIVPIEKPNGEVRICGDFKVTVNQVSKLDNYPIPKTSDLLTTLSGGQKFTKLDMSQAYQQLLLDDESKPYLTINTHKGLFRYNRLPYGVKSAPGIFQRIMENLLQDIPFVIVRMDDILISGKDDDDHLLNLAEVLKRIMEAGLRLNLEKCLFFQDEVVYCGRKVNKDGIQIESEKIRAVAEAPPPENVKELRSYLGMVNAYREFLPNISSVLAPLHLLLQKGQKWKWEHDQIEAFSRSKEMLQSADLLVHYDMNKELVMSCDASEYGIGSVLSHREYRPDGTAVEKPIDMVSRTLAPAEKNYSMPEKEGLAVIFGLKKFHQYIYGRKVYIYTDHKPLLGLLGENKPVPPLASARLQRWALTLSAYDYELNYRKGGENSPADAMSRLPVTDTQPKKVPVPCETVNLIDFIDQTPVTSVQIKKWTAKDPLLSHALYLTMHGWPEKCPSEELRPYWIRRNELSTHDGCLLWGNRIIVPPQGRKTLLHQLHESHPGVVRMKSLARSYMWWPNMDSNIEDTVRECHPCQENQKSPPSVPIHPWERPREAWSRIHLDYAGPFMGKMFLVIVDAYSNWVDVHITNGSTSSVTIEKLQITFANQGLPELIVTDNGPCFTSDEFENFCEKNGIKHITSPAYHPASNGLAEKTVQFLKTGLKKMSTAAGSLQSKVSKLLFTYRTLPHSVTGITPAELNMKRKMRTKFDLLYPNVNEKVRKYQSKMQDSGKPNTPRHFNVNDNVYVLNDGKWLPGKVFDVNSSIVHVKLINGKLLRRHIDHVRFRYDNVVNCEPELLEHVECPSIVSPEKQTVPEVQLESSSVSQNVEIDQNVNREPEPELSLPTKSPVKVASPYHTSRTNRRLPQKYNESEFVVKLPKM